MAALAIGPRGWTQSLEEVLNRWLAAQANLHSWSADALQTRELKSFAQPLISTGKVWVVMPDQFRWESGQPAQTIALRHHDELSLVYPRLQRVERYNLGGNTRGPWQDALSLLDASFPRDRKDLDAHFTVVSFHATNDVYEVALQPRSRSARQFIDAIVVQVHTNDFSPAATELHFSDGSRMRNQFLQGILNPSLDPSLFVFQPGTNYTVVEPLKK